MKIARRLEAGLAGGMFGTPLLLPMVRHGLEYNKKYAIFSHMVHMLSTDFRSKSSLLNLTNLQRVSL